MKMTCVRVASMRWSRLLTPCSGIRQGLLLHRDLIRQASNPANRVVTGRRTRATGPAAGRNNRDRSPSLTARKVRIMTLLGRADERDRVDRVLAAARQGLSGVLVLRGEPGIGKTALLEYAVSAAADLGVARVEAVESEMELGFAGLHQLLLPYLGAVAALPPPQRDALDSAFGLRDRGPPERFLVALATLTLLGHLASQRGLLGVADAPQGWNGDAAAV